MKRNGFTLLEVMIALAILAGMSLVLFYSSSQIIQSKADTEERDDAYHSVTQSMNRISDDLSMAFLMKSRELLGANFDGEINFLGTEERMDFVSMSNQRFIRDSKEGEAAEISYYLEPMPDEPGKKRLMRRQSPAIDKDLQAGGRAYPLVENIEGIHFEYLDEKSGEFKKLWDTKSVDFTNKLPQAVKIEIEVILPGEEQRTKFMTWATVEMNKGALAF